MMYEEDIAKVNEWFDSRPEESYGTYRSGREYSLDEFDLEEFKCFLRENFPDLVGIRCYLGTGGGSYHCDSNHPEQMRNQERRAEEERQTSRI